MSLIASLVVIAFSAILAVQGTPVKSTEGGVWKLNNELVDQEIVFVKYMIDKFEPKSKYQSLPDFRVGNFEFNGFKVGDLDSFVRTGDSWIMENDKITYYNGSFGLNDMTITAKNVGVYFLYVKPTGPVTIKIGKNSADVEYTTDFSNGGCVFKWTKIQFTQLDVIHIYYEPHHVEKDDFFSKNFPDHFMTSINRFLKSSDTLEWMSKNYSGC